MIPGLKHSRLLAFIRFTMIVAPVAASGVASAQSVDVLHSFGSVTDDGANPQASLIQASDGRLYGTTFDGGSNTCGSQRCGTVFRIDVDGSNYQVLHQFAGGTADGAFPFP